MATVRSIIQPMGQVALERFFRMVQRPSDGVDGCWLWVGGKSSKGYGRFRMDGKLHLPHRLAYQQFVGQMPEGHYVCHHCDNGGCVNPAHLFAGTNSDNMRDCRNKGRLGLQQPEWKEANRLMNATHVDQVRELISQGWHDAGIARHFSTEGKYILLFRRRYGIEQPNQYERKATAIP